MDFFQNIYDFLSTNIVVITILLVLGVITTVLEKSSKIATPIATIVKKSKQKKQEQEERWSRMESKLDKIANQVFENERDRLRGELFNCGSRCRRGIPLTIEEYRFISSVYEKYSNSLHANSIGTDEWHFIQEYFNNQSLNHQ